MVFFVQLIEDLQNSLILILVLLTISVSVSASAICAGVSLAVLLLVVGEVSVSQIGKEVHKKFDYVVVCEGELWAVDVSDSEKWLIVKVNYFTYVPTLLEYGTS